MSKTRSPIFIVGANRSGTTLLRLILNAHSNIAIPEELLYLRSYLWGVHVNHWRKPEISREHYERFVSQLIEQKSPLLPGIDPERVKQDVLSHDTIDFRRPYQTLLEHWMRVEGKKRWGEKTPANLFYADVIRDMFPDARFIHVVRDPRAGVASMMRADFFPHDVAFNALDRHKHMTQGRAILERHVPAEQRMTLKYENLVTEPEKTIKTICHFLEEEFEPPMLQFYKDASSYMKPSAVNDFNAAATKPISSAMIDKWMEELKPGDIATIEKICEEEMREFNYVPVGYPLSVKGWLSLVVKLAYWKIQLRRRGRNRHYTVRHGLFARSRSRLNRVIDELTGQLSRLAPGG